MPFKPGESGNEKGRPRGRRRKASRKSLAHHLKKIVYGAQSKQYAEGLAKLALEGNSSAWKTLLDVLGRDAEEERAAAGQSSVQITFVHPTAQEASDEPRVKPEASTPTAQPEPPATQQESRSQKGAQWVIVPRGEDSWMN
jgi:hypothetical protein